MTGFDVSPAGSVTSGSDSHRLSFNALGFASLSRCDSVTSVSDSHQLSFNALGFAPLSRCDSVTSGSDSHRLSFNALGFASLPLTSCSKLRYIPDLKIKKGLNYQSLGAPAENRTPDTLIKSQVLYQLSYRGALISRLNIIAHYNSFVNSFW